MAEGGTRTARGKELTRYVPVELPADKMPKVKVVQPPTPEEIAAAEEAERIRKQKLFDEMYQAKSTQPPLTFKEEPRMPNTEGQAPGTLAVLSRGKKDAEASRNISQHFMKEDKIFEDLTK